MRTWNVSKTRAGKPKVTLYEHGQVMLARPVASVTQGNNLGRVWADSDGPIRGLSVDVAR